MDKHFTEKDCEQTGIALGTTWTNDWCKTHNQQLINCCKDWAFYYRMDMEPS